MAAGAARLVEAAALVDLVASATWAGAGGPAPTGRAAAASAPSAARAAPSTHPAAGRARI
ncbi:MAG TPA: hypothetical protein VM263_08815 [Acidimicrobiales bacterium]|nr:hypothetical protein [Acidimicrobiales bacterium]